MDAMQKMACGRRELLRNLACVRLGYKFHAQDAQRMNTGCAALVQRNPERLESFRFASRTLNSVRLAPLRKPCFRWILRIAELYLLGCTLWLNLGFTMY